MAIVKIGGPAATANVPAGGTLNVMVDSIWRYLPRNAALSFYAVQDVNTDSNVELDISLGNSIVGVNIGVNVAAAVNVGPFRNEDGVGSTVGRAGDLVQITARETVGNNAGTLRILIDINEM